ncbi:hypothetical protein FHQ18_01290 [Deferribacter autotrophicus]|uniref:Uncharacterized protein n=1 Tax=Deferribacter autotrophicus TaxID=500465 RepID=A0A5A8F6R9_9BACT|nr:hypothetical protein [Deferribacter autotrophicus]KAA0259540.1 hypothetical protein FHQ18_01290 [Deferribacter autotrophicus]
MKERYLELKKIVVEMNDSYEFLNVEEREDLENYQKEMKLLESKLNDEDLAWVDEQFKEWYEKYIMMETLVFIKPKTG